MQGTRFRQGMLSRRQAWRRQSASDRRREQDFIVEQGLRRRAWSSDDGIFHDPSTSVNANRRWSTTGDLRTPPTDMNGNPMKSVTFSCRVNVILIPTIVEYENAGLADQLWWNEDDYRVFKAEALEELKHFMYVNRICDKQLAIQKLYVNKNLETIPPPVKTVEQETPQILREVHGISSSSSTVSVDYADSDGTLLDGQIPTATSSCDSFSTIDAASVVHPFCTTSSPPKIHPPAMIWEADETSTTMSPSQRDDGSKKQRSIPVSDDLMALEPPASMPFLSPLSDKHHKHIYNDDTTNNSRQLPITTTLNSIPVYSSLSKQSLDWVI